MENTRIKKEKFEQLLKACGSHSQAARELNIHPTHYRYVRRTGNVSKFVELMIEKVLDDKTGCKSNLRADN